MSDDAVSAVLRAIETTLSAGSARFEWFMPEAGDDLAGGYGSGAVDLDRQRLAMVHRFLVTPEDGGEAEVTEVPPLIDGEDLYMAVPDDEGSGEEWVVMQHVGLLGSPLAHVWWLRGAVSAERRSGDANSYEVRIHMPTAISRAGEHEPAAIRQSLDEAQVGLAEATIPATAVHPRISQLRRRGERNAPRNGHANDRRRVHGRSALAGMTRRGSSATAGSGSLARRAYVPTSNRSSP